MRVIVCGGRDWPDVSSVVFELERLAFNYAYALIIVHGACPTGVDKHASDWVKKITAERRNNRLIPVVKEEPHPADWATHGRKAGPIRNQAMADAGADLCLAFWDGTSKGTQDMFTRAVRSGIPVKIFPYKLPRTA